MELYYELRRSAGHGRQSAFYLRHLQLLRPLVRALLPAFPARQAATLEMLALLSRLRIELEQEFPDAWAFVRPGFDEQ
jgi:hypothetical protein